jgi:hypothetical protein
MCDYYVLNPHLYPYPHIPTTGAVRVSALSELGVLYIMTHDSIGLGEDGPTHQVGVRIT